MYSASTSDHSSDQDLNYYFINFVFQMTNFLLCTLNFVLKFKLHIYERNYNLRVYPSVFIAITSQGNFLITSRLSICQLLIISVSINMDKKRSS